MMLFSQICESVCLRSILDIGCVGLNNIPFSRQKMAMITILGEDSQFCPSRVRSRVSLWPLYTDPSEQIGTDIVEAEYDLGLCTHTALSPQKCMTIPDGQSSAPPHRSAMGLILFPFPAQNDWRFQNHVSRASDLVRRFD
jgi:hypothetical protein